MQIPRLRPSRNAQIKRKNSFQIIGHLPQETTTLKTQGPRTLLIFEVTNLTVEIHL